jgi:hypothetical protein
MQAYISILYECKCLKVKSSKNQPTMEGDTRYFSCGSVTSLPIIYSMLRRVLRNYLQGKRQCEHLYMNCHDHKAPQASNPLELLFAFLQAQEQEHFMVPPPKLPHNFHVVLPWSHSHQTVRRWQHPRVMRNHICKLVIRAPTQQTVRARR